jgi:phospholipase A-2-activating protein
VATVCPEAAHYVRALAALPVSARLPRGGFAAGASDNEVRVYHRDGTLEATLSGHTGGVLSLSVSSDGARLASGSWDGTCRVWDLGTMACVATLGGMENAISVLYMPNGDILAGSTGRKTADDRHVDYKIRVWRDSKTVKTMTDHDQAVRSLARLPDAMGGFVSAANDG